MPTPEEGVIQTGGTPPLDTGVTNTGTPPDEEVFEGEIRSDDGQRMIPLDAVIKERQTRQQRQAELEGKIQEYESQRQVQEPDPPDFNWDEILGKPGQSVQPPPPPPPAPSAQPYNPVQQFNDQYQQYMEENPFAAVSMVVGNMLQHQERLRSQAKGFVPDFDQLPINSVSDAEIQALANNPYAMKALIAKSRARKQSNQSNQQNQPNQSNQPPQQYQQQNGGQSQPTPQQQQQWVQQGRQSVLNNVGRVAGATGEGTGGYMPSGTRPYDSWELSQDQRNYYLNRGYTNDQITKDIIPRLIERKQRRGEV